MQESTLSWREELLTFYNFPPERWQSLSATNPIELMIDTIRHRTKRSKRCLNRDGMLYIIFKQGIHAERNWRRMRGFKCLAKVIEGIQFKDGNEVIEHKLGGYLNFRPTHYF